MTLRPARPRALSLFALPGIPMVQPGDDLAALIAEGFARAGEAAAAGDVLVVAQKIVSKSEGRYANLATVEPGEEARELAALTDKDPRMVELILSESRRVVRHRPGVIIVEHRLGFVMANAGIDNSNVEPAGADERVLLLPRDPDGSARRLREGLRARLGVDCAVIVNDSVGRAWRVGTVGLALGAAGLPSLLDLRGRDDLFGRPLEVTQVALALVLLVGGLLAGSNVRTRPPGHRQPLDGIPRATGLGQRAGDDEDERWGVPLREALRARAFWLLAFAQFAIFFAITAIVVLHVPFMEDDVGISKTAAGVGSAFFAVASLVGRIISGGAADRFDKRVVLALVVLVAGVAMPLFALVQNLWQASLVLMVIAAGVGGANPIRTALLADYFGTRWRSGRSARSSGRGCWG